MSQIFSGAYSVGVKSYASGVSGFPFVSVGELNKIPKFMASGNTAAWQDVVSINGGGEVYFFGVSRSSVSAGVSDVEVLIDGEVVLSVFNIWAYIPYVSILVDAVRIGFPLSFNRSFVVRTRMEGEGTGSSVLCCAGVAIK